MKKLIESMLGNMAAINKLTEQIVYSEPMIEYMKEVSKIQRKLATLLVVPSVPTVTLPTEFIESIKKMEETQRMFFNSIRLPNLTDIEHTEDEEDKDEDKE